MAKKTAQETNKWILEGMHRVLKYRKVEDKVSVRLAGDRYCWVCRKDENGRTVCGWERC